jgi:hypothetical protein
LGWEGSGTDFISTIPGRVVRMIRVIGQVVKFP